jgi:hypothetical protein
MISENYVGQIGDRRSDVDNETFCLTASNGPSVQSLIERVEAMRGEHRVGQGKKAGFAFGPCDWSKALHRHSPQR